ncbi:MAG: DUF4886 domain-containing protein [Clostridia bacterium]|nr:DUF4886 domain-containing protein [Clostridia bacterium]
MNILAIGNSFSQDASRYLHQIARADGVDLNVANLFIGGCSLYTHFRNMKGDLKAYHLGFNGFGTGFMVSIKEALLSQEWDVVTVQQASPLSYQFESFMPYITELADYVREYCPKAKLYIHQTWGYETDSERVKNQGYSTYNEMFKDVEIAYNKAFDAINADGIIKSGYLLKSIQEAGIEKVHRDTFHLHLGVSRYAVALLWYKTLTGNSIMENTFSDFDVPVSDEEIKIAKNCVENL